MSRAVLPPWRGYGGEGAHGFDPPLGTKRKDRLMHLASPELCAAALSNMMLPRAARTRHLFPRTPSVPRVRRPASRPDRPPLRAPIGSVPCPPVRPTRTPLVPLRPLSAARAALVGPCPPGQGLSAAGDAR